MPKRSLDAATMQTYLESLPEDEVATIFAAVALKLKRRWEFWVGVLISVVWTFAWIWLASGFGAILGIIGGFAAMAVAAVALWPFSRWVTRRILRDEVALRIAANGV
jgi:hypothetical protein